MQRFPRVLCVIPGFMFLMLAACSETKPASPPLNTSRAKGDGFDSVRELIRRKLEQKEAPSITVAVARDGKILWEEGFGWADKSHKRAATQNTPYRLGSVSKPITATAVMIARQRGLVDLD